MNNNTNMFIILISLLLLTYMFPFFFIHPLSDMIKDFKHIIKKSINEISRIGKSLFELDNNLEEKEK